MKKRLIALFVLFSGILSAQYTLSCGNTFYTGGGYAVHGDSVTICTPGIPNTSIKLPVVAPGFGLAVAPSLGFPAPDPTFWCIAYGGIKYFDGTNFVIVPHPYVGNSQPVMGGSKNYLYILDTGLGNVYRYNGLGNPSIIATVQGNTYFDIVGDDQDNFYLLKTKPPQALQVYSPSGVPLCSYSVSGIPLSKSLDGFAIVGNTVTAGDNSDYYIGIISGNAISFTTTPKVYPFVSNFANCYLTTLFSSSISASPHATISCLQTLTLTASPGISPVTYNWSGPGIAGAAVNQDVVVNLPGVYTCTMANGDCPPKKSVSSFTVENNGFFFPTIASTGSLSCFNPTTQLSVQPAGTQYTFAWNGPGITGPSDLDVVNVYASGLYSVSVTNTLSGCSATQTLAVTGSVSPLSINIAPSSTLVCSAASSVTLSATGAASYSWVAAAPFSSTLGNLVTTQPSVTTVYTLQARSGICFANKLLTVSVQPTPTLITTPTPTICFGAYKDISVSGAASYTWWPFGIHTTSVTVSPWSLTVYTVVGKTANCLSVATITVDVAPSLTVVPVQQSHSICKGGQATITVTGADNYTWSPGALTGSAVVVSPSSSTTYSVRGSSLAGCFPDTWAMLFVNVYSIPPFTLSPTNPTLCAGKSITLNLPTLSLSYNYTWQPGNVNTRSISVTPSVNTLYSVTVSTGPSCSATAVQEVTVVPDPVLSIAATATDLCSGQASTITPSGASDYTLQPGALTVPPFIMTPNASVNYTLTGNTAGCSSTLNQSIAVSPTPTMILGAAAVSICPGKTAILSVSGASSYLWQPGNIPGTSPWVTPGISTVYTVTGANLQCSATKTVSVIVLPSPTISVNSGAICPGGVFTITPVGAASYVYQGGSATVSPSAYSTYTVSGTSSMGCPSSNTAIASVSVNPLPTFSISGNNYVCIGSQLLQLVNGPALLSYTWSNGSNANPVALSPTVNSVYSVTVAGLNGCKSSSTRSITVYSLPVVSALASSTSICAGAPLVLSGSGAQAYSWSGGVIDNVASFPQVTMIYTVTGTDANGCQDTARIQITVKQLPTLSVTIAPALICAGATVSLSVTGAATYSWNTNETGSVVLLQAPDSPTLYTVMGTDIHGCSNTASVALVVSVCAGISGYSNEVENILVFPNPAQGELTIKRKDTDKMIIEIYSPLGQLIILRQSSEAITHIDLASQAPGIYTLIIKKENQPVSKQKIVRE